jgi:hypothetical protein
MVNNANQHNGRRAADQGISAVISEPDKIGASTPYDFDARNLTAYGGLLPVATMLACNLNCWLQPFSREENLSVAAMKHTTPSSANCQ